LFINNAVSLSHARVTTNIVAYLKTSAGFACLPQAGCENCQHSRMPFVCVPPFLTRVSSKVASKTTMLHVYEIVFNSFFLNRLALYTPVNTVHGKRLMWENNDDFVFRQFFFCFENVFPSLTSLQL
jgi:hypothetical protein